MYSPPVKQPANGRVLDVDTRTYNALLRCLGERGFALLTGRWRSLRHITASPRRIGDIVKAALCSPISNTASSHEIR